MKQEKNEERRKGEYRKGKKGERRIECVGAKEKEGIGRGGKGERKKRRKEENGIAGVGERGTSKEKEEKKEKKVY